MSSRRQPFSRWSEGAPDDALERELGQLFRSVPAPRGLTSRELAEVGARLRPSRFSRPPTLARYASLLGVGMLAGAAFAVTGHTVKRWADAPASLPAAAPLAVPAPRAKPLGQRRPATPPASLTSEPAASDSAEPVKSALVPPAVSGGLGRESELLARALAKLRSENHPAGALLLLDQYRAEFPSGTLALESELARLDAFLALGRRADALTLLDTLPLERSGRGAELRVVRAELRAQVEPARALHDFDAALAGPLPPTLDERARFGRAASRLRAGDQAGAARDLREYLARHPHGRFAAEARERLATTP